MSPHYTKIHNKFKYNKHHFSHSELKEVAYSLVKEGKDYEQITGDFLIDWLNDKNYVLVKTSGSTGTPKHIQLSKQAMVNSAIATGDFFNLKPGDRILSCLPSHYIAGKMMLVRAMILGLEIDCVAPTSNPIFNNNSAYAFSAMVPLQVENIIDKVDNIKTIIIGGAPVSEALKDEFKNRTTSFYETYGMTETATHVALKPLASKPQKGNDYFEALPNISFSQDARGCLIITAKNIIETPLITNDIVDLQTKKRFKWLGRFDNKINSGGVKLFPEQIENKLQSVIKNRFFIAFEADEVLGQKLILIVENLQESTENLQTKIKKIKTLDTFEIPKKVYTTSKFIETTSGKIQRNKTLSLVLG